MHRADPARRRLTLALGALAATAASRARAQAGAWPARPVRLVVAYPPGGPVDTVARAMAAKLTEQLGQTVIVDNRPGGNGVVGTEHVVRSAPDGYTLLLCTTPLSIHETLYPKMPYQAPRDFTLAASIASGPQALVVGTATPVHSLQELIATAKSQPGRLSYASPGGGGANHLAAEMLKSMAGLDVLHVPYKGGGPAEIDVIAGRVTFMFASLPQAMTQVKAGRLRALAVTSPRRVSLAPDLPTMAEAVPGFEVSSWYGIAGPAGLPKEVVDRLQAEVGRAIAAPDTRERLAALGVEPMPLAPEAFADFVRRDVARWAKVIRDGNVQPD
jgi:tripartite-type tricarboxylate transporter receptor subunit TctC